MKLSEFISGNKVERYQYSSFEPNLINHKGDIDDSELMYVLSRADIKLGELNAFSQLVPDIDFFVNMHVAKEGAQSSRIDGTQTNIEEAIQKEKHISPEKRDDWLEVQNYISAMNYAIDKLDELPLSNRLIRETQQILLQGVRGEIKLPGEFRKSQNWIGDNSLSTALFIPPHHSSIDNLLSDLELFLHNNYDFVPPLIKIGIAHYQFETIHPFLDGNGRIGRLLITLFLVSNDLLVKPTLYISDYFERYRNNYYDNLTNVRTQNDLRNWLIFFLEGVYQTAEKSINTFKKIIELRDKDTKLLFQLGRKNELAIQLLNYLFKQPSHDINDVADNLKINFSTAARLVDDFVKLNILKESTGNKRNRLFHYEEYLNLFK